MQVRVAGTEIIDRDFITRLTESLNHRRGFWHIDKTAFRHFYFDLLRTDGVVAGLVGNHGDQPRGVEIRGRQVNRNIEMRMLGQEMAQIVEHLLNDIVRNPLAHSLIFRQRDKLSRAHHLPVKARPA